MVLKARIVLCVTGWQSNWKFEKLSSCGTLFAPTFLSTHLLVPRFPPAPSPPRGVKGSLSTQFAYFYLDTDFGEGGCGASLGTCIGERGSRSQRLDAWCGYGIGMERARAHNAQSCVRCERSERAHAASSP
jgi:hypothetical protein